MAAIAFDHVAKRFGATVVADDLSLDVADGEFLVFLGPSGSGKSTLLHLVAGVEPLDRGTIRIAGRDVTAVPPQKRDVAMVFQSYALYPHLDVRDNLAFPLQNRGVPRAEAREEAGRIAASLGLDDLLSRKPRALSGGQRQRVALGRALIRRPAAFLMDEPLSNLDAALRLEIREEIKRIHQTSRITTIYVTHDQEEALALADRVAVLKDGRIQQCDAPAIVYARPLTTFVASFVGTPPINLLPAERLAGHASVERSLAGRDPATVTIGLRPHALDAHGSPRDDALRLDVVLVEPAGAETWVVAGAGASRIKARLAAGSQLAPGDTAWLTFAPEALHVFERESGRRVELAIW